jgi:hypothetical protein
MPNSLFVRSSNFNTFAAIKLKCPSTTTVVSPKLSDVQTLVILTKFVRQQKTFRMRRNSFLSGFYASVSAKNLLARTVFLWKCCAIRPGKINSTIESLNLQCQPRYGVPTFLIPHTLPASVWHIYLNAQGHYKCKTPLSCAVVFI